MPAVTSPSAPSPHPSSRRDNTIFALVILSYAAFCATLEYILDRYGFADANVFCQGLYWILVGIMALLGASLALTAPLLAAGDIILLWVRARHPRIWQEMKPALASHEGGGESLLVSSAFVLLSGLL